MSKCDKCGKEAGLESLHAKLKLEEPDGAIRSLASVLNLCKDCKEAYRDWFNEFVDRFDAAEDQYLGNDYV